MGISKQRFFSAQWAAYFADGLWLSLAQQSAAQTIALAGLFDTAEDCEVLVTPQINELFVRMPDARAEALRKAGAQFYDWVQPGDPFAGEARRFVTSWETTDAQIAMLEKALHQNP